MPNWKKLVTSGGDASLNTLKLTGLSTGTPTTALMLDGSNNVEKRVLGSLAFSSDTIPTNNNQLTNGAGYTTNTGTVTSVATGAGITGGTITGAGTVAIDYAGTDNIVLASPYTATGTLSTSDSIMISQNASSNVYKASISLLPFTNNVGDITQVNITAGDGLTGDVNTTSGAHTQTIDVDSTVVRTSGNQTIGGNKTFTGATNLNSTVGIADELTLDSDLIYDGINEQASSTNGLVIDLSGGNTVGYRALGSNAFNSTSIPTAASDLNLGTSNHVQFHCLGLGQAASGTNGNLRASTIDLSGVANPQITFNGSSDTGVDMAIKATPEGLDFYEPEDGNKIHFRVLDDTGVSATYGYQVNGTTVISSGRVLQNVSGNISQFTNDSGYLTSQATRADLNIDTDDDVTFDDITAGSTSKSANTTIKALAGDSNRAGFEAYGSSQGTGYVYVGQSSTYGGGMSYNGDGSPSFVSGESNDAITFFRRSAGTDSEVFSYMYNADAVRFNGDVIAFHSSDRKLKDNLVPIGNATEKLTSITGYEFDWNDKEDTYEGHDIGVVAQEVEKVLPEIVTTRDNGYKAVKYEKLTALLIQGFKEQQNQIEKLKNEILTLKENRIE